MLANDPPPPVWPAQFTSDIVEVRSGGLLKTGNMTGVWSYDFPRRAFRVDRDQLGKYDQLCAGSKLTGGANDSCVNLAVDGGRFLYSTSATSQSCCLCCTDEDGCGVVSPSWTASATLVDEEPGGLDGVPAYKWLVEGVAKNFVWTAHDDGALLALQQGDPHNPGASDTDYFVRSSLHNGTSASAFELPAFCPSPNTTAASDLCPGFCAVLRVV
jgi:hypothetical protein